MAFARSNGVLLHYRLAGPEGAPPLALVNSLGTDARIWDEVIERLAGEYRILSYDKRGHGLSDAPAGDYSLDDHIADLRGLLDHLRIDRLALAGVSIGGLIAQGFALKHADRLAALVLCDTAQKVGDAAFWSARIDAIRQGGLGAIVGGIMERWFSPGFRAGRPEDLAGWRNLFLRCDVTGYLGCCATLRDTDLTATAGDIAAPALVVAGEHDGSTPVEMVRAAAAAIPGAQFRVIPDAGHIPSIEQPEALAAMIRTFLKEANHG
jgi:3-oxoadipate enol-lactonase